MRRLVFALLVSCGARTEQPALDASVDAASDTAVDAASDAPEWTACAAAGQCLLVPRSCCGSCGAATPGDMIAVATPSASSYRSEVCGPGTACPACYMQQDPFLRAFCVANRCTAVDLHGDETTACATDADCALRYASCCEPCDAPTSGLLALRRDRLDDYRAHECAPDTGCPKCAVRYPDAARAVCDATKHCNVAGVGAP